MVMIRRLVTTMVLALVVGLVIRAAPDITRYLKIREM